MKKETSVNIVDVNINDIKMPFSSMVYFMVNWAIASIPAMLILLFVGAVSIALFGGIITKLL